MKFTNGYWLLRDEIIPIYAVEYVDHRVIGNELIIYSTSKHIENRGDNLNIGMLTIKISSPIPDVIKVSAIHFEGTKYNGSTFEVNNEPCDIEITNDAEKLVYKNGNMKAIIYKSPNNFKISYLYQDKELTSTSYRNLAYMKNNLTKKNYMVEQLALDIDENIYGLGERFTPFVKNGQVVDIWNSDGGTSSELAYKNIPFYLSSKGYGVFVENEGDVSYEIASEKVSRVQFSAEGEKLDYHIIGGSTPKEALSTYTKLTGKPALPPAWSFGLWLTTSFTTEYDEKTTTKFIQGMADRNIPLHVFHFDCHWMEAYEWCNFTWDKNTFDDPEKMISRYHDMGLKICLWINPYIGQKSPLFQECMEKGYFIKKKNGDVWQTDLWQAGMAIVDFTNPDATAWYQKQLKNLIDIGVDCFKTDFGERIPVNDIIYFDNSDPVKMHNLYAYLYNKVVFELLENQLGKNKAVVFARSAAAGAQKFPVHWGGDCTASYESMAESLRGGLSLSASGFGFWSHDISGFENTATADLYKRWCQFGLLSSHSRLHGSSSYRVPWIFDDEATDVLRKFTNLKCSLMPYIYEQSVKAHKYGVPTMRPMFLDFHDDFNCRSLDRQYMLGDSLLVAPIFKDNGLVHYYVPEGIWINLLNRKQYIGGKWFSEIYDYFELPLLIKPNSILPISKEINKVEYDFYNNIVLHITPFDINATFELNISDIDGNSVIVAKAKCINNQIIIEVSSILKNWDYEVMFEHNEVIKKEDGLIINL